MSNGLEFIEAKAWPVCPHCEATLERIEYVREKLQFGFMRGATWVIVLTCPRCHKVLGTQSWD